MASTKKNALWEGFSTFFKIGMFTLGGGYAMIPLMEAEVVGKHGWVTEEEFPDLIAASQSCPGVFAVNMSVFTGYRIARVRGALAAAAGCVMPSLLIILFIAMFFRQIENIPIVESAMRGIRPAVVAMIAAPTFSMARKSGITFANCWIPVASAVLIWQIGVNPVFIILAAVLGGLLYAKFLKD